MINLGVVIPSSPGFIGTYQWLAVSALGVVGVDGEVAIAFSLLMQAIWFVPTTIVGGVIAIREVHREATRSRAARRAASTIARVKVLLVSFYFPPRAGEECSVPSSSRSTCPRSGSRRTCSRPTTRSGSTATRSCACRRRPGCTGPATSARAGASRPRSCTASRGSPGSATQARLFGRRALVPDENVSWNLTAIPAAIRLVRKHEIDVVITTSPPNSIHLVGAAVKRATGARWVADLRDSPVAHVHRRSESAAVRAKEKVDLGVAKLVARSADAIVCVADFIADEVRALEPRGGVVTIPNGSDFDDFEGLDYVPGERLRITHTGSFFGKRDPRPFLQALHDSGRRRDRPLPRRLPQRRPRVGRAARPRRPARADPVRARARRRSRCSATPRRCCS